LNVIQNPTLVPQGGGFVYVDRDSGVRFTHCTVDHLAILARKHRTANNLPIGTNWSQDFIDNVCRNTPGKICTNDEPPTAAEKLKILTVALFESARSGFATLQPEEVQARQSICESCEYFSGVSGMFRVACKKCGCTGLKWHLKSSTCPAGKW